VRTPQVVRDPDLPQRVTVYEVGPRDGLQNEQAVIPVETKAGFVRRLVEAGLPVVEATSFVHPKWVPQLADAAELVAVVTQDDRRFPDLSGAGSAPECTFDEDLSISYLWDIETVPTLLRIEDGSEVERLVGWDREQWQDLTGLPELGPGLPDWRPGCGSLSVDPMRADELAGRFSASGLRSRRVEFAELEDEVVAVVPPDLVECTVEKVAVNAVMAGCLPEHLPVVLAALEAACTREFNMHGLLATTFFSGPVLIVNGPIRQRIGMNSGVNALGQGNRANSTIGRALQLVVRNVGGGLPGAIDRATLGNPGKYTFCFAEDESDPDWEPLSVRRGIAPGKSAVTLFHGEGVHGFIDQLQLELGQVHDAIAATWFPAPS